MGQELHLHWYALRGRIEMQVYAPEGHIGCALRIQFSFRDEGVLYEEKGGVAALQIISKGSPATAIRLPSTRTRISFGSAP